MRAVVFDLDGTITRQDTLARLLLAAHGPAGAAAALGAALLRGRGRRDRTKAAAVAALRRGTDAATFERLCRQVAEAALEAAHPQVLAALTAHRAAGCEVLIATAALEPVASVIASTLGVRVVATRVDEDGRLIGGNCNREEKARRVKALAAGEGWEITDAYGNSRHDRAMLALARRQHRVTRRGRIRSR